MTPLNQTTLTAVIWREGDQYVSQCAELGVSSCGDTPDEALSMLREAVELYLANAKQLSLWDDLKQSLESKSRFTAPLGIDLP